MDTSVIKRAFPLDCSTTGISYVSQSLGYVQLVIFLSDKPESVNFFPFLDA